MTQATDRFTLCSDPKRELFWEIPYPPAELHVECATGRESALGLLRRLPERGLGIVGTREPSVKSRIRLADWVRELKGEDLIIVSGFARGIDSVAHSAAVEAGLPTIAVMAAGLDVTYPACNRGLRERILASGGVLVSEFGYGIPPRASHFIRRNRIIAAWSKALWVVEAPCRSGALNTAKYARDLGRTCLATPCFPGDEAFAGNQRLIDFHEAQPFWSVSSLGIAWLELAARRKRAETLEASEDAIRLTCGIGRLSAGSGAATVTSALDWAIELGWPPSRFFDALRESIQAGLLLDENGLLLKNRTCSD